MKIIPDVTITLNNKYNKNLYVVLKNVNGAKLTLQ